MRAVARQAGEECDGWPHVVARLSARFRVIVCRQAIQWIVQRRRGERHGTPRWEGFRYYRTREALVAFCRTLPGPLDPAALARLAALPELFAAGVRHV